MIKIFGLWAFAQVGKSWVLLYDEQIVAGWDMRPREDPTSNDEEFPDMLKFNTWSVEAYEFSLSLKLSVRNALDLHQCSVAAGWNQDEHGYIEYWLFEEMGRLLEKKV